MSDVSNAGVSGGFATYSNQEPDHAAVGDIWFRTTSEHSGIYHRYLVDGAEEPVWVEMTISKLPGEAAQ